MSGRSESILPEDEQQALGQIIDKIGSEKPDLAEAIRLCAIPHWFNKEILASLRGGGSKPSERTETILDELKSKRLAFDDRLGDLFLHDNVRNLLLHRWRKENPEHFQTLNEIVAAYYEDRLQQSVSSDEQRAEWEREEMYHLLVADNERGIDRFKSLSNKAIDSYRLSTLNILFSMASEQADDLSLGLQLWIQFFEGKKDLVSGHWEKALKVWERLKEERAHFAVDLEKTLAVHLAILYKDKGEWSKAIECFEDSLKILERAGDENGMITILNNRGYLYKDREDLEKAENDFQRAHEISKNIGDERGTAISLKNLGLLYKDKRKWDEALEHFRSSLAILERIGDERGMAKAYNHGGLLYKDRGLLYKDRADLEKAEINFQRAREILQKIGDQRRVADIFNYLGFLYTAEMEWHDANAHFQRALTNFQEALTILKEMGDERGTAVILNNLGLLYQRKGEQQPAVDYFQQSLEIVEKIGDEMNAATTMYELALLYDAMEKYDKAIELLEKVLTISERVGHPDSRIRKSREKLEMVKAKATSSESASDQ